MADQVTVTLTVDRADAETALWVQQDGKSRLAVPADQLRAALDFPGEEWFDWEVTIRVRGERSEYAERTATLSGKLRCPPGDGGSYGAKAILVALMQAGKDAERG